MKRETRAKHQGQIRGQTESGGKREGQCSNINSNSKQQHNTARQKIGSHPERNTGTRVHQSMRARLSTSHALERPRAAAAAAEAAARLCVAAAAVAAEPRRR